MTLDSRRHKRINLIVERKTLDCSSRITDSFETDLSIGGDGDASSVLHSDYRRGEDLSSGKSSWTGGIPKNQTEAPQVPRLPQTSGESQSNSRGESSESQADSLNVPEPPQIPVNQIYQSDPSTTVQSVQNPQNQSSHQNESLEMSQTESSSSSLMAPPLPQAPDSASSVNMLQNQAPLVGLEREDVVVFFEEEDSFKGWIKIWNISKIPVFFKIQIKTRTFAFKVLPINGVIMNGAFAQVSIILPKGLDVPDSETIGNMFNLKVISIPEEIYINSIMERTTQEQNNEVFALNLLWNTLALVRPQESHKLRVQVMRVPTQNHEIVPEPEEHDTSTSMEQIEIGQHEQESMEVFKIQRPEPEISQIPSEMAEILQQVQEQVEAPEPILYSEMSVQTDVESSSTLTSTSTSSTSTPSTSRASLQGEEDLPAIRMDVRVIKRMLASILLVIAIGRYGWTSLNIYSIYFKQFPKCPFHEFECFNSPQSSWYSCLSNLNPFSWFF